MLRLRAVRALLVEEVAGVRRPPAPGGGGRGAGESGGGEPAAPESGSGEPSAEGPAADDPAAEARELTRARRRALAVALLCAAAVSALFLLRDPARPWIEPGRSVEGAFTVGVLLVTAYAGFRLAQYLQLRTVSRLHRELIERERKP